MKTNTIVSFIVATLVALLAVGSVCAGTLAVSAPTATVNDIDLVSGTTVLAAAPGETIPIVIKFAANADLEDLKLKVWVDGYKSDVSASTARFDVVNGSSYSKKLSLTLPSVQDMDDNPETLTFYVRIADKDNSVEEDYTIKLQREPYVLDVLSVEMPSKASAGEIIALDVVLKNWGARDAEDIFVTASIPELGISKKAYFGDLVTVDNTGSNDNEDAKERKIYLVIPADVKSGDYTLEVKASDYDATATAKKLISITGLNADNSTGTATPVTGKDKIPTSVIVLTVALVIIFLVLLVVLIVLLTKKPAEKSEDFGETSYY